MNITNPKLSDDRRTQAEAAPWVIAEIEKLEQQLASAQGWIEGVKEQRDVERAAYLNEFEKNQVIVAENARLRQHLDGNPIEAARQTGYMAGHASRDDEFAELRQQVTLMREPLLYIDEVAKTSKTIMSVAAAAMKMLKKIRAALAATKEQ